MNVSKSQQKLLFSSRCRYVEEERNILLQVRKEMSEEFKNARKTLEESLRELEILKRKATRLEDENQHLVSKISVIRSTYIQSQM